MRTLTIMLACIALAGCGGNFQLYASAQEAASAECQSLGLMLGTAPFANCYEQSLARRQSAGNALVQSLP